MKSEKKVLLRMKVNKRRLIAMLLSFLCVTLLLCSCDFGGSHYQFLYDASHVEKIEIVKKTGKHGSPYDPVEVLKTVDEANHAEVLASIQDLSVWDYINDPMQAIGRYQFRIYYKNGEIEIVGGLNNAYISPDGKWTLRRTHFETNFLEALILDILTEKSE